VHTGDVRITKQSSCSTKRVEQVEWPLCSWVIDWFTAWYSMSLTLVYKISHASMYCLFFWYLWMYNLSYVPGIYNTVTFVNIAIFCSILPEACTAFRFHLCARRMHYKSVLFTLYGVCNSYEFLVLTGHCYCIYLLYFVCFVNLFEALLNLNGLCLCSLKLP